MSSSVPGCPAAWESDEDADLGIPELYDADLAGHGDEESEEEVEEEEEIELAISRKHAKQNYNFAGTLMKEEKEKVEVEDFKEIMDERVDGILDQIDAKLGLPYKTAPFQRIALNCMGTKRSVVVVVECGAGKMDIALKGSLLMREVDQQPDGVTIVLQPLTSLMQEKMKNKIANVAVLSMAQQLTVMAEDSADNSAVLSCTLEQLVSGQYSVLIGHPESFATPFGQQILRKLRELDLLLALILDEFHLGADGQWDFRPVGCNSLYRLL
jgi:superfamily II DNA helicase RecQ